ncbi:Copper amine oxidase family protein [Melia azedarach]|uniref:Copper amine oxidase family protein n=1 Tax=Melia azedarach TaxID=155640 RepID=A0ACC1Z053_MELAZ|nr:Copper amine oxidase family protein [Melia azedarach]
MASKTFTLTPSVVLLFLLLSRNFGLISASRPLHFHPPALPRSTLLNNKPKTPAFSSYTINRYKYTESEAFRPTSPGHSPGVGHQEPPGLTF